MIRLSGARLWFANEDIFVGTVRGELEMSQISVTPETLIQQAKVYTQARDQIEAAKQQVKSMNDQIASEWQGQAFQSYLQQYAQLEKQVNQFEELLTNINQQLNQYAQTVQERDQQDAKSFGF